MAVAKKKSTDATGEGVFPELGGISALKEDQEIALKAFLSQKEIWVLARVA